MPLTWPAAFFGLLFGVSMAYAPYEFRATFFRPLYPHVRAMGMAYLVSSVTLLATMLYPRAPRWLDALGRVGYGAATGLYWWVLNVHSGGITGALIYPLLMVGVALEASPNFRQQGVLRPIIALKAVALGTAMLLAPEQFPPVFYAALTPLLVPAGLLFLASGVGLLVPANPQAPWLQRALFGLLVLPFSLLTWALARSDSWPGAIIHLLLALSCSAAALNFRPRAPRTVGWKLLRGLAFAGLVPLLALGGVATYLAQRTIEHQLRDDTELAAASEADFLVRYLDDARQSLQLLLESPGLHAAFAARDRQRLEPYLRNLSAQARAFDAALVVDAEGLGLAASYGGLPALGSFTESDFYQGVKAQGAAYISRPYISQLGRPHVAVALPFIQQGRLQGVLVGLLSLERLSAAVTPAAQRFRVQVVDRRCGLLLRDTQFSHALLSLSALTGSESSPSTEGVAEIFGPQEERLLVAQAPVPGTDWTVSVSHDLGEAYGGLTRLSAAFIALLVTGVVLTLLLSQVVARDVIRRLGALHEATADLAQGDLSRRVAVESTEEDELAALSRSFNDMAERTEAAQAELREAVRAREEFLSVASHELRTPLTPLKSFASLTLQRLEKALDFPERERMLKALRSMARQTDRLTRLVDDLLDTSRIQAGRFDLERHPVDLVPLVREVLERFELRGEQGLQFELDVPQGPVQGEWDGARLEQVVTNLLSNAVRYSPQGGKVRVGFLLAPEHVELQVSDEGIGIPPESLGRLFQPFVRASNATSRHFGGLGLGLFICREIVQRHGGHIWAESRGPQQGSCFHVRLPRQQPVPEQPVPEQPSVSA